MTSPIPADLQNALSDRYELRRVLGRGGMATVYLAYDRKHHREVAIKVLLPTLAAFLGAERFLKEIEIAARLTHPHILPLHDSGESAGFLYYVMPFVEGGSLRDRLTAGRRLEVDEILGIMRPVVDALSYAHRMGVLHRDIKPENILFSQGHPIVGDFGIARAVSTAGGTNLTRTGFPVGTPGYMSPEQAAGLTDIDQKTDVYSVAVVIYEMLQGELPGRWPTEEAVRIGRFLDATERVKGRFAHVDSQVEAALVRALAIRHDQRTATPAALVAEMTGKPESRPRYSAEQVTDIVRRASELEATTPTQSGAMTIGGVEALAAEVGIPAEMVREAAAVVRRSPATPVIPADYATRNKWLNGPTRIVFERIVDGELPDGEYPTLVDEIRYILQNGGQVNQLGRSFTWSPSRSQSMRRDLEVMVAVRGGKTRITVFENLGTLAAPIFGGIGGGLGGGGMGPIVGVTAGALNAPLALIVLIPAWFTGVYFLARTVYRRNTDKRKAELEKLIDRLAQLSREIIEGGRAAGR
ncbi:MAG TPA: serine/threonine-protein kinase [Gemmatimonadales bacterium]|nr:serine/threonine-protein kinase [Gemmatimonadales bacterium]